MRLVSADKKQNSFQVCHLEKTVERWASSVPVGDERQRRTGQQLLELMGAQDLAAEINLPDARARPGTVQQRRLALQQAPVLREKTSPVLPITLLISNTPELLSEGRKTNTLVNKEIIAALTKCACKRSAGLTSLCRRGSNDSRKTLTGGHLGSQAEPPWSPPW